MPPKAKFTKEEITEAAFNIVRTDGFDALTSRELGIRIQKIYICLGRLLRINGVQMPFVCCNCICVLVDESGFEEGFSGVNGEVLY